MTGFGEVEPVQNGTVAVVGGSGLYDIQGIEGIEEHWIDTPYGKPSDSIISGTLFGTRVLFLPRHGRKHSLLPSEINYRANMYAMKMMGAAWCISVSAVGSLQEEIAPGDLAVPDQLIDRTIGRTNTFFGAGLAAHVSFADPYCPVLRQALIQAARPLLGGKGPRLHDTGTYVCIEGPAFSTRAESRVYRQWGGSIIGMTNLPEAKLAREAEIAYATLALVTDYDCWRTDGDDVDVTKVLEILRRSTELAKLVIPAVVKNIRTAKPSATAAAALDNALITKLADAPDSTLARLRAITKRYEEKDSH